MRRKPKLDSNHNEIVNALRTAGCSVQSLAGVGDGCPDLLIGCRGHNILAEVKDGAKPPSARRLTRDEVIWIAAWKGERVLLLQTLQDVVELVAAMAYRA